MNTTAYVVGQVDIAGIVTHVGIYSESHPTVGAGVLLVQLGSFHGRDFEAALYQAFEWLSMTAQQHPWLKPHVLRLRDSLGDSLRREYDRRASRRTV